MLVFGFLVSGLGAAQELDLTINHHCTRAGCPVDCTADPKACSFKIQPAAAAVDSEIAEYLFSKLPWVYDSHSHVPALSEQTKGIAVFDSESGKYSILSCEMLPARVLLYICKISETDAPGVFPVVSSPSGILDLLKAKVQ